MVADLTERTRSQLRLAAQYQVTRVLSSASSFEEAAEELLAALCENLDWAVGVSGRPRTKKRWRFGTCTGRPVARTETSVTLGSPAAC